MGKVDRLEGVRVLDHVRALPPGEGAEAAAPMAEADLAQDEALEGGDARAFREAGWTFLRAGAPSSGSALGTVIDRDGHLKVLAPGLTVRFEEGASPERIAEILKAEALVVRRRMGFQSQTYTVEGQDALAKAKRLNAHPEVVYADPVMIEPMSSRTKT